jgi:ubiquinone/menaquinone biosynthesis C-methylase UbiE
MKLLKKILNNHEYLIEQFLIKQESKMLPNQRILDAGAGQCQYKYIFEKRHNYIAQDLCVGDKNWDFSHINIKSPIHEIPAKSSSFDYIICTQVLEHVPNPQEVMSELSRLLKKNGKILFSVPLTAGEHQIPYHFFNYTRYGLKILCDKAKLKINFIDTVGGFFAYIQQMIQYIPYKLFGESRFIKIIFYPYRIIVGTLGLALDRFDKDKKTTEGYVAVFQKI